MYICTLQWFHLNNIGFLRIIPRVKNFVWPISDEKYVINCIEIKYVVFNEVYILRLFILYLVKVMW